MIDAVRPEFKRAAKQRFIETITPEDIDSLKAMKRHGGTRDFCLALLGQSVPWHRRIAGTISRLTRPLVWYFERLLRNRRTKLLKRHIDPLETQIDQLNDLVNRLCREIVELRKEKNDPCPQKHDPPNTTS